MGALGDHVRLDPERVGQFLDDIAALGNRFQGTPGEIRCRDYLAERMAAIGAERVRLEPFRHLAYEPVSAACRIASPAQRGLECRPLLFTASASAAGEAVYVGTGSARELALLDGGGVDLAGKIAVSRTLVPFEITPGLLERHVVGLVNIGDTPDGLVPTLPAQHYPPPLAPPWEGRPLPFPGVCVESNAGADLVLLMSCGHVALVIDHVAIYRERTAHNVIGEFPGTGDEGVVVGAHYDTMPEGPGLWDNGTGIAGLLALGESLAGTELTHTVTIAAFGVEETGIWGSKAFVAAHPESLDRVLMMINLDGLASRFGGRRSVWVTPSAEDFAVETARLQRWPPEVIRDARAFAYSDNTPFVDAGIPSCWFHENPPVHPYIHSAGDVRDLVDARVVAEVASVATRAVHRIAVHDGLYLRPGSD